MVREADAVLSLACGAGVQFLAERYPDKPILPGLNTNFIGVNRMSAIGRRCARAAGTAFWKRRAVFVRGALFQESF
jgi:hypothetical protein